MRFKELKKKNIARKITTDITELLQETVSNTFPEKKHATAPGVIATRGSDKSETTAAGGRRQIISFFKNQIEELRQINGYKAAAIIDPSGELLASDSIDPGINLNVMGATYNDIFRVTRETTSKVGLDACNELLFHTPQRARDHDLLRAGDKKQLLPDRGLGIRR